MNLYFNTVKIFNVPANEILNKSPHFCYIFNDAQGSSQKHSLHVYKFRNKFVLLQINSNRLLVLQIVMWKGERPVYKILRLSR